jgi:eukaryotic-like serine/threonine-protein kinase
MSEPQLIGPVPGSSSAEPGIPRDRARPLPYDLLQESSKRLEIMSLLAAALWVLGTLGDRVALAIAHGSQTWRRPQATDLIAGIGVLASLGMFFYLRRKERDPRFILDLGPAYMVLMCFCLGLVIHWSRYPKEWPVSPMISWIGAVVLMSAAIVPNSPRKTLIAGLIAVSMNPLGMVIAKARGTWEFGSWSSVLVMHYPDYLMVGVAVLISAIVTRLGQQVTRAREMGSYRLVTLLGKGGMGEVWRARHHMLARDAAIKLIQPQMLSRRTGMNPVLVQRRFEQEAKTTALLRSPHTVELYDFGVTKDGVFYYVMELLEGIDLETLVKKFGPQPPARVVSIVRQVCRSLADAHHHGLVHRDIKPTNIFLCRMGNEYDFVKVLDFGLVKVLDDDETKMTVEGATTGTPAYMSPEQTLGKQLDGRADLYGLGCVAYWLVTGRLVFEEKNAAAMMLAHLQKIPVAPSQRGDFAVPACLDRAIMMCLAKEPAERPNGAEVLSRLLEGCNEVGAWSPEDAERWWRTHMAEDVVRAEGNNLTVAADPDALTTL